jgi:hypothetical protein
MLASRDVVGEIRELDESDEQSNWNRAQRSGGELETANATANSASSSHHTEPGLRHLVRHSAETRWGATGARGRG